MGFFNLRLNGLFLCLMLPFVGYSSFPVIDQTAAYLDKPYSEPPGFRQISIKRDMIPLVSDVDRVIDRQTSVKAQKSRQTCSIFSTTALVESLLHTEFNVDLKEIDLSEQWLDYLSQNKTQGAGTNTRINFASLATYGMVSEKSDPYIEPAWRSPKDSELAQQRCGHLKDLRLMICLLTGRDPDLLSMMGDALQMVNPEVQALKVEGILFRENFLASIQGTHIYSPSSMNEVKRLLSQGVPLSLDLDFFYGAWNHASASQYGLTRNMDQWSKGIVGYPELGSRDLDVSRNYPSGHSVLVVGYDDRYEVSLPVQMRNGTIRTFTYQGVFYFKNSWGTDSFGSQTVINGKARPGYGILVQQYAEHYGRFYRLPLRKKWAD